MHQIFSHHRTSQLAFRAAGIVLLALLFLLTSASAQSSWTQLGLAGEDLSALAFGSEALMLAGGGPNGGNGMFRSTNAGITWTPINSGLGTISRINTIAIQPDPVELQLAQELIAVTEAGQHAHGATIPVLLIGVLKSGGPNLFRSTDLGDSWSEATAGLASTTSEVTSIVFDPSDPLVAYAALNSGGVFKSVDGGLSWSDANNGLGVDCGGSPCILDLVIDPSEPATLYAANPPAQDVFKTVDAGVSWLPTSANLFAEFLAIDPNSPETVYSSASLGGLLRTTNGGDSWDDLSANANLPSGASHRSLAVASLSSEIWLVAEGSEESVYRSVNGGDSWVELAAGLEGLRIRDLEIAGGGVLAATDDGVYLFSGAIFSDGFESGDTLAWPVTVPGP